MNAVGARVIFVKPVDRYPHCLVYAGETGTVSVVTKEMIAVKLDCHHQGLDEWDNEVHFTENLDNRDEFFTACERLR